MLSWLSGRPCRSLSSLPEAVYSQYCCCIVCQCCLPNTDCHGLERACSFAHIRQPAPSQGPSPRLFSPPQIEIRTCPVPSCLPARMPKLASPLGGRGICTSTPGKAQFQIVNGRTPCAIRIEAGKASSVSPILDSAHWPDTRQTELVHEEGTLRPVSVVYCHRTPTKTGVSADTGPDPPDAPHRLRYKPSRSQPRKGQQRQHQRQHLQLRYHMQAPSDQARLSGITTAGWDRPIHHWPAAGSFRLTGEVVHCRWFCFRSRPSSS